MFPGRLELAIAAYNAGENAVVRYGLHVHHLRPRTWGGPTPPRPG